MDSTPRLYDNWDILSNERRYITQQRYRPPCVPKKHESSVPGTLVALIGFKVYSGYRNGPELLKSMMNIFINFKYIIDIEFLNKISRRTSLLTIKKKIDLTGAA